MDQGVWRVIPYTGAQVGDGTVWAWGNNPYGALGDGTKTSKAFPVQVSGLSGVAELAGGGYSSFALKNDGTVWSWGYNYNGQLGDGTKTDRLTPVQVSGLSQVVAIAAGGSFALALKDDGTVWSWGNNNYGQLGDGTTTEKLTPVQVIGLSGIIAIAGGGGGMGHSLALKSDGTVWAWGCNSYGELGDGSMTNSSVTVPVSGLSGVTAISAGAYYYSAALKDDGTVWTWGSS